MQELHFQNTLEDLVAFNLHRADTSRFFRNRRLTGRWIMVALLVGIPLAGAWISDMWLLMLLAPPFAIFGYITFPRRLRSRLSKIFIKQLVESSGDRFANIPRKLVLEDDGLLSTSEVAQSRYPYASLAEITEAAQYIYIVAHGGGGYAIPRAQLAAQQDAFFAELRQRIAAAKSAAANRPDQAVKSVRA